MQSEGQPVNALEFAGVRLMLEKRKNLERLLPLVESVAPIDVSSKKYERLFRL